MRKVVIHSPGGHDRLVLETAPDPTPGRGEVRIRTEAIGVNYADVIVRMGLYASAKEYVGWPITPGFEVAGTIDAERAGSARAREEIARIEEAKTLDVRQGLEPWLEWFIDWWNGPGFYRGLPEAQRAQFLATAHRQAGVVMAKLVQPVRLTAARRRRGWFR